MTFVAKNFARICGAAFMSVTILGFIQSAKAENTSLSGHFVQGGVIFGQGEKGDQVFLDGNPIDTIGPDGRFVIGIGRDEKGPLKITVHHANGQEETLTRDIAPRTFNIQRIDGLPQKMVTPDPKVIARIKEDARQAHEARKERFTQEFYRQGFIWPVVGPLSGVYGSQRILNGEPRSPHWGVDIAVPKGTPVLAPADGIVTLVAPDMYYSGGTLFVDHGLGVVSAFLHLSKIDVKVGDVVHQGQIIAHSGASGRATGPHLDWRINVGSVRIDASLLVPPMEQAMAKAKSMSPAAAK